jgi:hypothetical protein
MTLTTRRAAKREVDPAATKWDGPYRRYDLIKEFVAALLVVCVLAVVLAAVFSSPNDKPATLASWARADPQDFVVTAVKELDGSSDTAGYGPPYNSAAPGQKIGPVGLAKFAGVRIPIDTAEDFVLKPLATAAVDSPALTSALATWRAASSADQARWTDNYTKAAGQATFGPGLPQIAAGDYGPVAAMMTALLDMARSSALDGALVSTQGFYNNDYTKPLLFLGDGSYLSGLASNQHLGGDQWGMMNEEGNYPGQAWLWLYTFWYQISPFKSSGNADALIWAIMALLTLVLILVPFIPGLRSVPKLTRVYRIIWREHYRNTQ